MPTKYILLSIRECVGCSSAMSLSVGVRGEWWIMQHFGAFCVNPICGYSPRERWIFALYFSFFFILCKKQTQKSSTSGCHSLSPHSSNSPAANPAMFHTFRLQKLAQNESHYSTHKDSLTKCDLKWLLGSLYGGLIRQPGLVCEISGN